MLVGLTIKEILYMGTECNVANGRVCNEQYASGLFKTYEVKEAENQA
jgi:hypothetical protein